VSREPRLEFRSGRSRRLTIVLRNGKQHNMPYDAEHLDGLRVLADRLARSLPGAPEH